MRSILAASTTLVHLSMSAAMRALNASGLEGLGRLPTDLMRSTVSGSAEQPGNLGVEPLHDRGREAGRRHQSLPGREGIARQARLGGGRHVRQAEEPRRAGHRQRPHLAGADELELGGGEFDDEIDALGEQVGDRLRAAAIGHVLELGVDRLGQQLAGKMLQRAVAGAAEQQRRAARARRVDELRQRADGSFRIGAPPRTGTGEHADHREIVDGAIAQRLVERRRYRMARWDAHQRVSIGRYLRDLRRRDPAAGARPGIDTTCCPSRRDKPRRRSAR